MNIFLAQTLRKLQHWKGGFTPKNGVWQLWMMKQQNTWIELGTMIELLFAISKNIFIIFLALILRKLQHSKKRRVHCQKRRVGAFNYETAKYVNRTWPDDWVVICNFQIIFNISLSLILRKLQHLKKRRFHHQKWLFHRQKRRV